jgi:hypothetical protein
LGDFGKPMPVRMGYRPERDQVFIGYHGTKSVNAKNIKADGFNEGASCCSLGGGIYTAPNFGGVSYHSLGAVFAVVDKSETLSIFAIANDYYPGRSGHQHGMESDLMISTYVNGIQIRIGNAYYALSQFGLFLNTNKINSNGEFVVIRKILFGVHT